METKSLEDLKVNRKEFFKGVGSFVKGFVGGGVVGTVDFLGQQPTNENRTFILNNVIKTSYTTCVKRMDEFLHDGWPVVETVDPKNQGIDQLGNVSAGFESLETQIENRSKPDKLQVETSIAKLTADSNFDNFGQESVWYIDETNDSKNNTAQIPSEKSGIKLGDIELEVLKKDGIELSRPFMGGITKFKEAYVTPSGQIIGRGEKLDPGSNSLFFYDPERNIISTFDLEENGEIKWSPLFSNNDSLSGVCVSLKPNEGDSINLAFVGPETSWKWKTSQFSKKYIGKNMLNSLGIDDQNSLDQLIGSGSLSVKSLSLYPNSPDSPMGFAEVVIDDNVLNLHTNRIITFGSQVDGKIFGSDSTDAEIVGKVGDYTVVGGYDPQTKNLVDINFLSFNVDTLITNHIDSSDFAKAPVGRLKINSTTLTSISDGQGNLIVETNLFPNVPIIYSQDRAINEQNPDSENEFPWENLALGDKIKVDEDTVFVYVPGGGGLVPVENIQYEMGWEKDLHLSVFRAKYGENAEAMYQNFRLEMVDIKDYSEMFSVMSKYGMYFMPWNLVIKKDKDSPMFTPDLNMAFQVFRLISTFKDKEVVLIGHSKGANVVQEMLKMIQNEMADPFIGKSKIVGALMYGRIMPPTQMASMVDNINYDSHNPLINAKDMNGLVELSEISTGIDSEKIESKGIKAFDVYDPRDPQRISPELIKYLLDKKVDLKSLQTDTNMSIILLLLKLYENDIRQQLPKMDFTPFKRIITRKGVPQDLFYLNLNRMLSSSVSNKSDFVDYHSNPVWSDFFPMAFSHVDT